MKGTRLKKSQLLREGYAKGLRQAQRIIGKMLSEDFNDTWGGRYANKDFAGRRNGQPRYSEQSVNQDYGKFMRYAEKAIKKAVATGEYDYCIEDYDLDNRTDIVEANLKTLREVMDWIEETNDTCRDIAERCMDESGELDMDDLSYRVKRKVKNPLADYSEYEIWPLIPVLIANNKLFALLPDTPARDIFNNIIVNIDNGNRFFDDASIAVSEIP